MKNARPDILLVEDNPDEVELVTRALRKHDFTGRLVVARDGQAALDLLHGPETTPSLLPRVVLLDVNLPRVDGLEVLRRIRSHPRTRTLPVVMLSSSGADQDVRLAYREGANSYVVKPVRFDSFAEAIGSVGRYWVEVNQRSEVEAAG